MQEYSKLYRTALYYDIVFGRDVSQQVDFILDAVRYYGGQDCPEILELGCGPAYHARALAKKGVRVIGLDNSPDMLKFAQNRAEEDGVAIEWILGDVCNFRLDKPVDAAITMFNGLLALCDNEAYKQHFRAVAENLKPNGIYIADFVNPRTCSFHNYGGFHYAGERDGVCVHVLWGTNKPKFDWITGIAYVEIEIKVNDNGKEQIIHDSAYERLLFPQEVNLLAELSGALKVTGWHGSYSIHQPFNDSPETHRMIVVLKKNA